MTNNTIDPGTNLPQLPEGMFWRVGKSEVVDNYYTLYIMEAKKSTLQRSTLQRRFWGQEVVTTKETIVAAHRIQEFFEKDGLNNWKEDSADLPTRDEVDSRFIKIREYDVLYFTDVRLSTTTIRVTADKMFKEWVNKNTQAQEEARLLGDYPPKML